MAIPSAFSPGSGDLKFTSYNDFTCSFTLFHRYTLWIPLYPLGFICEGVIALRNIPYFEETDKYISKYHKRLTISKYRSTSFHFLLKGFRSFSPTSGTSASTSPTQSGSTSCLASSQCSILKCGTCTSSGVIEVLIMRSFHDDNLMYQFDIFYPGARSLVSNSTSPTSRNPIRIC